MTTPEKSEAIIRKILEIINGGKIVQFEEDWGEWSATIFIGSAHTHIGGTQNQGETFDSFVGQLYNVLHGGPGLSWVESLEEGYIENATPPEVAASEERK